MKQLDIDVSRLAPTSAIHLNQCNSLMASTCLQMLLATTLSEIMNTGESFSILNPDCFLV